MTDLRRGGKHDPGWDEVVTLRTAPHDPSVGSVLRVRDLVIFIFYFFVGFDGVVPCKFLPCS